MNDDIDPDRKFSNGTDWDNSIDWDDASDGSDGGYDRHGSPINANAMKELVQLRMETSRLRADLAAVTKERDRMREALLPFADIANDYRCANGTGKILGFEIATHISYDLLNAAVIALKGTKPASPWLDIESAPKDGMQILAFARSHTDYYGVAEWAEADADCQRSIAGWFWPYAIRPTHWKHLPIPPANTQTGER